LHLGAAQQAQFPSPGHGLSPVPDAQFAKYVAIVPFDGAQR